MGNEFTPESQSLCDRRGAEDTPSGPSNPAHILLGGRAGGGGRPIGGAMATLAEIRLTLPLTSCVALGKLLIFLKSSLMDKGEEQTTKFLGSPGPYSPRTLDPAARRVWAGRAWLRMCQAPGSWWIPCPVSQHCGVDAKTSSCKGLV